LLIAYSSVFSLKSGSDKPIGSGATSSQIQQITTEGNFNSPKALGLDVCQGLAMPVAFIIKLRCHPQSAAGYSRRAGTQVHEIAADHVTRTPRRPRVRLRSRKADDAMGIGVG